mmetsp:Transcript_49318/g.110590  ORF Transcript_49318/g.110590 Transcript_49318/m.110590 type:complete len:306 (+) Transcript_49318:127-1044(+)
MPAWQKGECGECGQITWVLSLAAAAPVVELPTDSSSATTDISGEAQRKDACKPRPPPAFRKRPPKPAQGHAWLLIHSCRNCQKKQPEAGAADCNRARCGGCGRIFLAERIARHTAACAKVSAPRAMFSSASQRVYREGGSDGRVIGHGRESESSAVIQERVRAARMRREARRQGEARTRSSAHQHRREQDGRDAGFPFTQAEVRRLQTRDLTPEDYELLLRLDETVSKPTLQLQDCEQFLLAVAPDGGWEGESCAICLGTMSLEEAQDVRALPACGHTFHTACVKSWLSLHKANCPLCQRELQAE